MSFEINSIDTHEDVVHDGHRHVGTIMVMVMVIGDGDGQMGMWMGMAYCSAETGQTYNITR